MPDPIKHYTVSALIISNGQPAKVLLLHHRKQDRWIQPGGHQESYENALEGVIREVQEETGIDITGQIPSASVIDEFASFLPLPAYMLEEKIAAHGTEPEHYHLDMFYVVRIPEQAVQLEAGKAHDIGWFTLEEVEHLQTYENLRVLLRQELTK